MTLRVRFASEAQAELRDAARWYERRTAGMGVALVEAVDAVVKDVADWPQMGAVDPDVRTEHQPRRYPLGRFPYHLIWVVNGDEIYMVAVAHDHRQPGYWAERLEGL